MLTWTFGDRAVTCYHLTLKSVFTEQLISNRKSHHQGRVSVLTFDSYKVCSGTFTLPNELEERIIPPKEGKDHLFSTVLRTNTQEPLEPTTYNVFKLVCNR